jgi:molybdopterin-guanine dinucleotide biosynthesis protein A
MTIAGAILAGGQGRRMGGIDKPLADLAGRPLISHVAARFAPQVDHLTVNANGDPARFAFLGLAVVADRPNVGEGPLAGLATMLARLDGQGSATHLATAPADTPFLPYDLVARLSAAVAQVRGDAIAIAASAGRMHPVAALWPVSLSRDLDNHLATARKHGFMAFLEGHAVVTVDFATPPGGPDPFLNVNTPDELAAAALHARR